MTVPSKTQGISTPSACDATDTQAKPTHTTSIQADSIQADSWFDMQGNVVQHIALNNRAFQYADAFFTTIRVHAGKAQLLSYHMARLEQSAQQLAMQLDIPAIMQRIITHATACHQGVLKVHVTRSPASQRGYAPDSSRLTQGEAQVLFFVSAAPLSPKATHAQPPLPYTHGIDTIVLKQTLGLLPHNLVGIKTVGRLEQVLAANELQHYQQQYQQQPTHVQPALGQTNINLSEGIVCDIKGQVIEGVSSNLFFHYNNTWFTPTLNHSGVSGVVRSAILQRMTVTETPCTLAQLSDISALFFCNSVRGIQAARCIYTPEGHVLNNRLNVTAVSDFHAALCDNSDLFDPH